jgi:homospermidine synthase
MKIVNVNDGIAERFMKTGAAIGTTSPSSGPLAKLIKSSRSTSTNTASTESSDTSDDDVSSGPVVSTMSSPREDEEEEVWAENGESQRQYHPAVVDVPSDPKIHAVIDGPMVIIGFGSIGRGVLPLIERHIRLTNRESFVVIEPSDEFAHILKRHGVRHLRKALTIENYESTLRLLFPTRKNDAGGGGRGTNGMIVNVSVDVESVAVMSLAQELGALYVDTVIEPWPGVYFGSKLSNAERTNYALRENMREAGRKYAGGTTAVSGCGANPGMVSWLMKEALLRLANDTGVDSSSPNPETREDWARLAMILGVKGVHVAERDTQISSRPKPPGVFVNTWSVDGLLSEGYQPAELGWGTHERRLPRRGHRHTRGPGHGIWIDRPGGDTRVRSWVPGVGPQLGLLVTHNESLSIADYYTVREEGTTSSDGGDGRVVYRPTCHYAYHPCNDCILSLYETNGSGVLPARKHILTAEEIVSGNDDLGVLLYGHARGAMWYGSRLSIEETRRLAPYQNATGLQVTSAVLAAMVWALENPRAGFVEADEMDHVRCLQIQRPYLGSVECHYTDWTPVRDRINSFSEEEDRDDSDPWQFTNFLTR